MTADTPAGTRSADGPAIPGLRLRPFNRDRDLDGLVDLITEANVFDVVDYIPTAQDLRVDLERAPDFDPDHDVLLAETDGRIVGATLQRGRLRTGTVVHYLEGWIRPAYRRRGLGRELLHWAEARAREIADVWPGEEPHAVGSWPDEHEVGAIALLESEGYRVVRYGYMMVRPLDEPIVDAPLPDGLEIRPVVPDDHRRIWDADVEAFRDHWEAADRTEEDFTAWYASPELDTSLWRVAWDGADVAGSVLSFIFPKENESLGVNRGWLQHISVRRPWRRRGLASALISESLHVLRERGLREAALGVDAENASGALRLYESHGFRKFRMGISYRKSL